ncbi:probable ribonuclease ZC3H12D [Phlebotomus argentipes]|uniref:probable ribonuclease ZC3H12D n=1 Tax=Phlebotomus argentipes TaxID=94469 RepID=UPI002892B8C7|nr:probable ribonuclease ZC3H12D [Phlebotomus argentipes]
MDDQSHGGQLPPPSVRVKRKCMRNLENHLEKIVVFYGVKLLEAPAEDGEAPWVTLQVVPADAGSGIDIPEVTKRVQHYIESLCIAEAEDSSYDSDCEVDDAHQQVSRTTSDTLGQEFAEYVSSGAPERSPGYTARVEFALKLGYTERLVQAALARLGPNPAQNELLAELIKLGALHGTKSGDFAAEAQQHVECVSPTGAAAPPPPEVTEDSNELRPIVVDGSNVAMSHGNKQVFSCRGIKLCVDWFRNRGHKDITVFVPKWRKEASRPDHPIRDQEILNELERERMLVFTPSRLIGGKRMVCYDDRYILKLAAEIDGIVVSNDNYRDLGQESSEFKKVSEERVLMYSFVNDRFMPPDDPLGRTGPTLENFLRIQPKKGEPPPPCPYGKKCTYGNKCKYNHPERGSGPQKSVTERLSEYAARHLPVRPGENRQPVQGKSLSVPLSSSGETSPVGGARKPLSRTRSSVSEGPAMAAQFGVMEQQPQGSSQMPYAAAPSHSWDPANFPKSHSIENLQQQHFPQMWVRQGAPASKDDGDSVNLHRKLQRQLTLNPAGCDPRIYQIQRMGGLCSPTSQQQPSHAQHRPVAPSLSGPRTPHCPTQWDLHQNVTRNASAPDPARPWHGGPPPASSSEPHLWSQQQQQQRRIPVGPPQASTAVDQRRRLHYHLASIFPEEQVKIVMQMYPDETNPQKICAAILNMFPKM